jgi:hypothetical protein
MQKETPRFNTNIHLMRLSLEWCQRGGGRRLVFLLERRGVSGIRRGMAPKNTTVTQIHISADSTANEGPVRIQYKCLDPIHVFTGMKLCNLLISKTEIYCSVSQFLHSYISVTIYIFPGCTVKKAVKLLDVPSRNTFLM